MNQKLIEDSFQKAKQFILQNARQLDISIFNYEFENGSLEKVYEELQKFQNEDGGFGCGLEPDFRTQFSSNIATTIAFQYLTALDVNDLPVFMLPALKYFKSSYDSKTKRWIAIPPETNDAPHAIWWNYDVAKLTDEETWGNPTVEILGYLIKHTNDLDSSIIEEVRVKAADRLKNKEIIETHELQCYARYFEILGLELNESLKKHLLKTVEVDSKKWVGYVTKPSAFIQSSKSMFLELFQYSFNEELDVMITNQDESGGWLPNWEWYQYPEVWQKVKLEIAGMLTVKNLMLLKRFNRI